MVLRYGKETMHENDYNFDPATEAALEELMGLLGKIPKNTVTMLNVPKYGEAIRSANQIIKFVRSDCPDAEATLEFDGLTGTTLCLRIIADELNIYKIGEFCKAIEPANTMDVIPRLDEKLEIGFTYEGIRIPVPPASN